MLKRIGDWMDARTGHRALLNEALYERVLGGFVYSGVDGPDYLDWEDRYATLLMVGDLYAYRETAVTGVSTAPVQMSTTVEALLAPYRIWSV